MTFGGFGSEADNEYDTLLNIAISKK